MNFGPHAENMKNKDSQAKVQVFSKDFIFHVGVLVYTSFFTRI
jgi:hypothetical protein